MAKLTNILEDVKKKIKLSYIEKFKYDIMKGKSREQAFKDNFKDLKSFFESVYNSANFDKEDIEETVEELGYEDEIKQKALDFIDWTKAGRVYSLDLSEDNNVFWDFTLELLSNMKEVDELARVNTQNYKDSIKKYIVIGYNIYIPAYNDKFYENAQESYGFFISK